MFTFVVIEVLVVLASIWKDLPEQKKKEVVDYLKNIEE